MPIRIKRLLVLTAGLLLASCAAPHYDYMPKSANEVPASVRGGVDPFMHYGFEIQTINGVDIGHDWWGTRQSRERDFNIPPGQTTITGSVGATKMVSQFVPVTFTFMAQSKHIYYTVLSVDGDQLTVSLEDFGKTIDSRQFTVSKSTSVIVTKVKGK